LIAAVLPLIIALQALIIVIDAFNAIAKVLAPVLEPLAPLFEKLQPIIEKLIPIIIVLTTTLVLLATPIGPLILLIGALYLGFVLITGGIRLFKIAFEELGNIFPIIIENLNNGKNTIIQTFTSLINGLIDSIPGARAAIDNAKSGTGGSDSGGGGGAVGNFIRSHFAEGGFVSGKSGTDKIRANLTSGEFVIRKDVVDSVGKNFLDFVNSDGFLNMTKGANRDSKKGLIGALSSEINNPGTNIRNLGTASSDLFNANANSRDYYLKNYYGGDGANSTGAGITSSSPQSTSGNASSSLAPVINAIAENLTSRSSSVSQNNDNEESKQGITINIDLRGSHFTGEDVANVVEQRLVEKLSNEQGQLARVVRDIKKDR
jgi:hypothetical protein